MSQRFSALTVYIGAISLVGILLNLYGFWTLLPYMGTTNFWLLIGLAIAAAAATTSVSVSKEAGITYHIVEAVSLASATAFGALAGVIISTVAFLVAWLAKPQSENWKKNLRQLAFNASMDSIAAFAACAILVWSQRQLADTVWLFQLLPWFIAAVVLDTINILLLVLVLRLQHGRDFNIVQSWREMQWSSGLNILIAAFGGWILAFAMAAYDWQGILVFFFPILLSAYAFRLYINNVREYMENLESIVEERTAELTERTTELADINRQKDTFLTVLTHDMITPLTSIRMCTEMLADKAKRLPDIEPITHLITRNQRVLINLAHNIMDIEKLQAGAPIHLEKELVEVGALIIEAVQMMEPEAQAKEIVLGYELDGILANGHQVVGKTRDVHSLDEDEIADRAISDPASHQAMTILADRQQMQRILLNLISNAVKYTPANGAAHVRASIADDQFVLEVEDNGYGIAPDELPNIFERFMRASQMRGKVTGTGIGLAVVKSLVQAHNGKVDVTSAINVGTKFTITIPVSE